MDRKWKQDKRWQFFNTYQGGQYTFSSKNESFPPFSSLKRKRERHAEGQKAQVGADLCFPSGLHY